MKQKGVCPSLKKLLSNRMFMLFVFLCFCSGLVTGIPLTGPYQTGLPDLVIEHVTWSPQFPQDVVDYKNTKFKITVRNRGQAPAENFSVTVAVGGTHVAMMTIEYLSPQRCVVIESSSFLTRSPGKYAVRVFVDGHADSRLAQMKLAMNNKIAESDDDTAGHTHQNTNYGSAPDTLFGNQGREKTHP